MNTPTPDDRAAAYAALGVDPPDLDTGIADNELVPVVLVVGEFADPERARALLEHFVEYDDVGLSCVPASLARAAIVAHRQAVAAARAEAAAHAVRRNAEARERRQHRSTVSELRADIDRILAEVDAGDLDERLAQQFVDSLMRRIERIENPPPKVAAEEAGHSLKGMTAEQIAKLRLRDIRAAKRRPVSTFPGGPR